MINAHISPMEALEVSRGRSVPQTAVDKDFGQFFNCSRIPGVLNNCDFPDLCKLLNTIPAMKAEIVDPPRKLETAC